MSQPFSSLLYPSPPERPSPLTPQHSACSAIPMGEGKRRGKIISSLAHHGADLFVHIKRQVIQTAGVFAGRPGALPTAKGLETRPGTGGRSLRTVDISYSGLDLIEEPLTFLRCAVKSGGQTVGDVIGKLHALLQAGDLSQGGNRDKHLLLPQAVFERQIGHQGGSYKVAFGISAIGQDFTTGQYAAGLAEFFSKSLVITVGIVIDYR